MSHIYITKIFRLMKATNFKLFGILIFLVFLSACADEDVSSISSIENPTEELHELNHRNCGHTEHMEQLLSDPTYKEKYEKRMKNHKNFVSNLTDTRALCSSPTVVPVAIHYQGANSSDVSCLISMAQESVTALNADFQGNNSDISSWTGNAASSFPGINFGEACLEFVLANTNHPAGYGLTDGDLAVTVNKVNGDFDSNWSGYLNIFVMNANGSLGYAPLGGAGNGDGVVIDQGAFGTGTNCGNIGSSAPYNLGRTLTHEVGHYLLLDHIWGGGCGQDDGIADTPNSSTDYGGCPNIGASSCGSTDLHMNYMDYTNDACMYMFTAGQAIVTENYTASSLGNITNNASSVINGSGGGNSGGGSTGGGSTGSGGTAVCGIPASTNVVVLSDTSAEATWEAQPQAIKYQVRYRVDGTSTWVTKTSLVAQKTLVSLSPSTTYEYKVRTRCPSGWTAYTAVETFATTGNSNGGIVCAEPSYSEVEVQTTTKSKVTWEPMPQAIRYHIRYRVQGVGTWITRASSVPSRTLTGLQEGATYEYMIRTRCPIGWTGYSATETFVQTLGGTGGTGGTGGGGTTLNTVNFNLTLDDYGSETSWELVDASNAIVSNGGPFSDGSDGMVISEVFNLADGCYTIYVDDAYGDGICCAYGNGSFEILDITGTVVGYSNGQFGNYDYIDFCVTNNVVTFQGEQKDDPETNLAPKSLSGSE